MRSAISFAALVALISTSFACGDTPGSEPDADAGSSEPDADLTGCDRDELREWFMDADEDGFGDPDESTLACEQPTGFVDNSDDCNDASADSRPDGTEVLCDGLDNDCDPATAEMCASGCTPLRVTQGIYAMCINATTQPAARVACQSMDMELAQIDDSAENIAVRDGMVAAASGGVQYFVGGQDSVEGQWRWPDGTLFWLGAANGTAQNGAFVNWKATEPNNANNNEDCMEIEGDATWNDVPCTDVRQFACERP